MHKLEGKDGLAVKSEKEMRGGWQSHRERRCTRPHVARLLLSLCLCACFVLLAFTLSAADTKATSVRGLTAVQFNQVGIEPTGSAGLFVGVARFDEHSGLPNLRYTVDDAVLLADLFVHSLGLIPPSSCQLALAGPPTGSNSLAMLARLKASGVVMTGASKNELLRGFVEVSRKAADAKGIAVVAISTHGFEEKGAAFVMPSDGRRDELEETGLRVETIRKRLANDATSNKKLLILDACREVPVSELRNIPAMPPAFLREFKESEGFAILSACAPGQLSLEDSSLGHGVFSYQLRRAFTEGGAVADGNGFIRLGAIAQYAAVATRDHVRRLRNLEQVPNFTGDIVARGIPLAFNQIAADDANALARRKADAISLLAAAVVQDDLISSETQTEVTTSVKKTEGAKLDRLLSRLELLRVNTPVTREDFANFWARNRKDYVLETVIPPVSATVASNQSVSNPPAGGSGTVTNTPPPPLKFRLSIRPNYTRGTISWNESNKQLFLDTLLAALNQEPFEIVGGRQAAADYILFVEARDLSIEGKEVRYGIVRQLGAFTGAAKVNAGWRLETGQGVLVSNQVVEVQREGKEKVSVKVSPQGNYNKLDLQRKLAATGIGAEAIKAAAQQVAADVLAVKLPQR